MVKDVEDQLVFELSQVTALIFYFMRLLIAGFLIIKVIVDEVGTKLQLVADDGITSAALKCLQYFFGKNGFISFELERNEFDCVTSQKRAN